VPHPTESKATSVGSPHPLRFELRLHLRGGRRLQMVAFKVYVLRDDGHVISQVDLFCNVGQAKEWAKALVDDKPVELWKGPIRIARFEPSHGRHASRSAPAGVERT